VEIALVFRIGERKSHTQRLHPTGATFLKTRGNYSANSLKLQIRIHNSNLPRAKCDNGYLAFGFIYPLVLMLHSGR